MTLSLMETAMQKRTLGSGGLDVSAIGFGCMSFAGNYGPAGGKEEVVVSGEAVPLTAGEPVRIARRR